MLCMDRTSTGNLQERTTNVTNSLSNGPFVLCNVALRCNKNSPISFSSSSESRIEEHKLNILAVILQRSI